MVYTKVAAYNTCYYIYYICKYIYLHINYTYTIPFGKLNLTKETNPHFGTCYLESKRNVKKYHSQLFVYRNLGLYIYIHKCTIYIYIRKNYSRLRVNIRPLNVLDDDNSSGQTAEFYKQKYCGQKMVGWFSELNKLNGKHRNTTKLSTKQ